MSDETIEGQAIEWMTGATLARHYRDRTLSPVEVTRHLLARAEELNPELNCFAAVLHEGAMVAARASERRWSSGSPLGPVDGVPATVKENVAVAGHPRPSGTRAKFDAPVETRSGPAAERILAAGGVILGITVMPDYGMLSSGVSSLHGITRSPLNPALTTGGSSSGAGAAAAAGIGVLHVGSDIGGSLRLPATWLGLVALKPSFGRVAVDPPYMGRVAGPLTRTTGDAGLLMSVIAGPDVRDSSSLPDGRLDWLGASGTAASNPVLGLRVAFHVDGGAGLPTDPEVAAAIVRAAQHFESAGAEVEEISPPMTPALLDELDRFLRVRSLADYELLPPDRQKLVLPFIRDWVTGAGPVSATDVIRSYGAIQELRASTVAATAPYDLVLSPVSPVAAFPAEWPMPSNDPATALHHIAYTAPYNFSEQPASSVNCGFTADGRTIGLQIAGRRFDDLGVLRATRWFEASTA